MTHTGQTLVATEHNKASKHRQNKSERVKVPHRLTVWVGSTRMIGYEYERTVSDTFFVEGDKKKFEEDIKKDRSKKFLVESGFEIRANEMD